MVAQVVLLMWMRTTMNYQHANGLSTWGAITALYEEGGIARLYQGWQAALLQAPISRFGDTAANAGVISLLQANPATRDLPLVVQVTKQNRGFHSGCLAIRAAFAHPHATAATQAPPSDAPALSTRSLTPVQITRQNYNIRPKTSFFPDPWDSPGCP